MLTYWETLTAIQSNVPVNDSYAQLWGRKSQGGYTVVTYIGTLPTVLTGTKAGYLHRYKIYGNTEQIGTPTPENPIVPQECGELETAGARAGQYKLPLASAGQNVDIYLGESQTTRRIKKIKARDIIWNDGTSAGYRFYRGTLSIAKIAGFGTDTLISNKYKSSTTRNNMSDCEIASYNATTTLDIVVRDDRYSSASDWLLANGDTDIYYVLATEEIGTLNEPLRKIGNYVDAIDSAQTSAQIPTSAGSTTISWAGEGLAPSQVELEYEKRR